MVLKTSTKIVLLLLIINLILIGLLSAFAFISIFPKKMLIVQSGSMENPESDSIDDGDIIKIIDVDRRSDVTTYVEGGDDGYKRAGSYGDVLVFRPNGDYGKTPVLHRAVIWIEFNSSTYDTETGLGGGYDVPSLGLSNVMSRFTIEDYEWPSRPGGRDLEVNIATILYKFRTFGLEPHGGFLTKGDDNDDIDQISTFAGPAPVWIQPVEMRWIDGIYKTHMVKDPLNITCCISWIAFPIFLGIGIYLLARDIINRPGKDDIPEKRPRGSYMRNRARPLDRSHGRPRRSRARRR